ncbi:MAG: M48 family metallopeptidase [Bdellovibrionaceae bacterium]|nr:M48 family metallopeptidase [Pseudobdellovibrionaceae bacterium]
MQNLNGFYFNGQDSRKFEVELELHTHGIVLFYQGEKLKSYALNEFKVHSPLASSSRIIEFTDGARFESFDYQKFESFFPSAKHQSWVFQMENRITYAVAAAVIGLALLLFTHFYLIPWSSKGLAFSTPKTVLNVLETSTKKTLSLAWKVKLVPVDAQKYSESYAVIENVLATYPDLNLKIDMISPHSMITTANAFALPAGQILINKELLDLVTPEELHAILLHEVGHVYHRHSLQGLIKSAGLYAMLSLAFGVTDFGSLTLTLLNAAYSRDDEREADDFSAEALAKQQLNPLLLADGLSKIEAAAKEYMYQRLDRLTKTKTKTDTTAKDTKKDTDSKTAYIDAKADTSTDKTSPVAADDTSKTTEKNKKQSRKELEKNSDRLMGILSTHPLTTERIERLQQHATKHGFPTKAQ